MPSQHRQPSHERPDQGGSTLWDEEIRHHLRPGYAVLGVGNRLRGDDGAGAVVAERLAAAGLERAIECGGVPENFLGKVERLAPRDVLFVDAVDSGAPPGTVSFFGGEEFQPQAISTHASGLSPLMDFLAARSEVTCWVLAIQPARVGYGEGLSDPVRRAVERIASDPVWFE